MRSLFPLAFAAALGFCATSAIAENAPRQCFALNQVNNTQVGDPSTLYARVRGDIWRIGMTSACLTGLGSDGLIFEPTGAGQSRVCGPLDLNVRQRQGGIITSCIIKDVRKLTAEEAAALPKKARP